MEDYSEIVEELKKSIVEKDVELAKSAGIKLSKLGSNSGCFVIERVIDQLSEEDAEFYKMDILQLQYGHCLLQADELKRAIKEEAEKEYAADESEEVTSEKENEDK